MPILDANIRQQVKSIFEDKLKDKVKLIYVYQSFDCQYCNEIDMLLTEISELTDKIELRKINYVIEKEEAEKYGVERVPAIVITDEGENIKGIYYYGIPSGYEFSSLIEDIIMVSNKDSELPDEIKTRIKTIDKPVNIKVFVTPTCPYCPRAVRTAHKFALENPNIVGEMIEAIEFNELANRFFVSAVPKIVINDSYMFEGALPDEMFLQKVLEAIES